jgi:hypothetical protein
MRRARSRRHSSEVPSIYQSAEDPLKSHSSSAATDCSGSCRSGFCYRLFRGVTCQCEREDSGGEEHNDQHDVPWFQKGKAVRPSSF